MRILQIINSLGTGGAEKLLLDTIPLFKERGIEMDLLVFWDNKHPFLEQLRATKSCKIIVLNESENSKDIYKISNCIKLSRYLKNYDVVHVHLFPAQYFVAFANQFNKKKAKLIFTEHSTFNKRMSTFLLKDIDKWIYKFYTKIAAISNDVSFMLENHISNQKDKIVLIENGVNLNRIEESEVLSKNEIHPKLSQNDTVLCQVSAFREGKDQLTLIKSLKYLDNSYKIVLVGDGSKKEKDKILSCIKELNLEDRVYLLGIKTNVFSIIKSVDINILSTKFEGLSLSSIEGMASGKPFIASKVKGIKEIVEGAGELFEYGNYEQLAQIINKIVQDDSYRNEIILKCKLRAQKYDINKLVDNYIAEYTK